MKTHACLEIVRAKYRHTSPSNTSAATESKSEKRLFKILCCSRTYGAKATERNTIRISQKVWPYFLLPLYIVHLSPFIANFTTYEV